MARESTFEGVRTARENRRGVIARRVALALMTLAVIVGATGLLGVKARTVHASGLGYSMTLTYPQVARSGLDIPWRLTVHAPPSGFPKQIVIAVSNRWWDIIEFQGIHPSPSDETATPKFVYLTYTPPSGSDTFSMSIDTYIQPSSQLGRQATVQLIADGTVMTQLHYKTWLVP